jgi:hypothetical protein
MADIVVHQLIQFEQLSLLQFRSARRQFTVTLVSRSF